MIFNLNNTLRFVKKNAEITFLFMLLACAITSTTYYNNNKKIITQNYKEAINNIYFKKTISYVFDNLTPRYRSINHKISKGETFNKILSSYSITNDEIVKVYKNLSPDYNLNNLKTGLIIRLTLDESNKKKITSFMLPVSRTKKVLLSRNLETDFFEKKILITNLNKKIIFKEGRILQSLYKSAVDLNIQPNIIVEFARIYGFQVDFQRDIRRNDVFQIMYEVFEDDNGKIFESGNVIFANLKLSGNNNSLYYFDKKGREGHYDENGKKCQESSNENTY